MAADWRTVALVVGAFYIGNFLTVGFHDYSNALSQDKKTAEQLRSAEEKLSASSTSCQLQTNAIASERDSEKVRSQTLEKQNRDQQSSINGCLTQAIKLIPVPEPLKTEAFILESGRTVIQNRPGPGRQKQKQDTPPQMTGAVVYLVVANKPVIPPRVIVSCDGEIRSAEGRILIRQDVAVTGQILTTEGSGRISEKEYRVVVNHQWGPMDPLAVTVLSDTAKKCSFKPE